MGTSHSQLQLRRSDVFKNQERKGLGRDDKKGGAGCGLAMEWDGHGLEQCGLEHVAEPLCALGFYLSQVKGLGQFLLALTVFDSQVPWRLQSTVYSLPPGGELWGGGLGRGCCRCPAHLVLHLLRSGAGDQPLPCCSGSLSTPHQVGPSLPLPSPGPTLTLMPSWGPCQSPMSRRWRRRGSGSG